jgi:acetoacetate decarboxylase
MQAQVILQLPSMPLALSSRPHAPYRFIQREYLIITYKSDPDAIRAALPEPLRPDGSDTVLYGFIRMPASAGFSHHIESGNVIPALHGDEHVNFTAQMCLDDEPSNAGGREIWGFPKKHARPKPAVQQDALAATLEYAGVQMAVGTMGFKRQHLLYEVGGRKALSSASIIEKMSRTQVNLKLIPEVGGTLAIAQLVGCNLVDIQVHGASSGPAWLHLVPHVNAPVADLPVRGVLGGLHFIADLTLPYGRMLHDDRKHVAGGAR